MPLSAPPIWEPDPADVARSRVGRFSRRVNELHGAGVSTYLDLWRWSVDHPDLFWQQVWEEADVLADGSVTEVLADPTMPGTRWFPGVRLNYAEHALRMGDDDALAVTSICEDGRRSTLTWGQLRTAVGAVSSWLRERGVSPGDRVVTYGPNGAATLVGFLATASLGAIWSACAQDYGPEGAAAKFAQLRPKVLLAADGYHYNGRVADRRAAVAELRARLPSVEVTVWVPGIHDEAIDGDPGCPGDQHGWEEVTASEGLAELRFERVEFDAPLWILFSSGTTGAPKGIVHGHGGVLLEHVKHLGLHCDLGPARTFMWYTSTNWMMWNLVVSGLLVGAPIVLYDGSPTYPEIGRLWSMAAAERVALLGVSPGYLAACARADLHPSRDHDLSGLRAIGSTGAPLPASAYLWVRDAVGPDVQVGSGSGGTDVVSAFAASAPNTPVWPGEISAPCLGVALEAWGTDGRPRVGEVGELVVTKPMPSMPVGLWGDEDGSRYRETYFSTWPGVWRHGDWIEITDRTSVIISGRSDSTLNRHGVRLGSADIYAAVEQLPAVSDALVIGAELPDGGYWLVMFVVLAGVESLDDELAASIKGAIATGASPRHVPDDVIAVRSLPHTRTGKRLEVPVKRLIQGQPIEQVASRDAVDDWDALSHLAAYAPPTGQRTSRA